MKDVLMTRLESVMEETLKHFFAQVECDYHLPKGTLWKKWNDGQHSHIKITTPTTMETTTTPPPAQKKECPPPLNKKSDYQTFFSIQRNRMVKENPTMTFGEISKQVSHMWKKLTPEEKTHYTTHHTPPITDKTLPEDLRKEYMKLSTSDLKNLCRQKGIVVKFRKKEDIVGALVAWEENKANMILKPDPMISKGRSKLELSAEDKDEEEDDFFFHDDGSSTSNESRACDEEDAGILISDDEDIFADDD